MKTARSWFVAASLALLSCGALAAGTTVRTIAPGAVKGAVEARAAERAKSIAPDKWSVAKKNTQVISVAPMEGKDSNSKVRVLDLFPVADAFHFTTNPASFHGALYATFDVLEPANALLSSQAGSSFWSFQNMTNCRTVVFYNGGSLDVRKKGVSSMLLPFTSWKSYTGNPMTKGVYTLENKGTLISPTPPERTSATAITTTSASSTPWRRLPRPMRRTAACASPWRT
ncbi:MAG: hypothetical protein E4H23_12660 [Chrysiogenales bacterium]|nr:MAG: hypothetical protein E4H23_12660 [Chrysiogenales bacterium]